MRTNRNGLCCTCWYWRLTGVDVDDDAAAKGIVKETFFGVCRFYAPVMEEPPWPITEEYDTCREHRPGSTDEEIPDMPDEGPTGPSDAPPPPAKSPGRAIPQPHTIHCGKCGNRIGEVIGSPERNKP